MDDEKRYKRYSEKVPIFKGLSPGDVEYILKHGKVLNFFEGKTIFHEGMLGSNLFIVLHGEVGIYQKNELIAKCKVGDAFGEMAVLNHEPRSATAASLTESRCFTLDERQVSQLLKKSDVGVKMLLNIIHVLSHRLESANAHIRELKHK